jgi:hypothetical protein
MNYYKEKYFKYKTKYITLKKSINQKAGKKGKIPGFLRRILQTLKYGTEEVPVAGEAEALISTLLSTSQFLISLKRFMRSHRVITKLLKINFNEGPRGVNQQFNEMLQDMTNEEITIVCNILPDLFEKIKITICDWISIIPEVGPAIALVITNTNVMNFKDFNEIYIGLPDGAKYLFEHPHHLHKIVNDLIIHIQHQLGVSVHTYRHKSRYVHKGGSLLSSLSHVASKQMEGYTSRASTVAGTAFGNVTRPSMTVLHAVGLDEVVVNKILNYIKYVLRPATRNSVIALKIIFPLFFTILLANDKC